MDLKEYLLEKETIYDGNKIKVIKCLNLLPNSKTAVREYIERAKNTVIIGLTERNTIIMEKQYRQTFKCDIESLPAGKSDLNEAFIDTAKREFREETGYVAENWIELGVYYPAPAYSTEIVKIFLATNLSKDKTNLDADEFLNVYEMDKDLFYKKCFSNEIFDARTIIAAYKLLEYEKNSK